MNFIRSNIQFITVIILVAILLIIASRGCIKPLPSHKEDKTEVQQIVSNNADRITADSLRKEVAKIKSKYDSVLAIQEKAKERLKISTDYVSELLSERDDLKNKNDELGLAKNCDTLAQKVKDGYFLLHDYENRVDSSQSACSLAIAKWDYQYSELDTLFNRSQRTIQQIGKKYDDLYKDYTKAQRNKVFLGVNFGSNGAFIGAGPSAILETSNGRIYQLNASYLINNNWYYSAGLLWKIHL